MRMLRNLVIGAGAMSLLAVPTQAKANTLTLDAVISPPKAYQQTTNRPCVIGENSCTYVAPFGGDANAVIQDNNSALDITSARFQVSTIRALFGGTGNNFMVGFDVNQTSTTQTFSYFAMLVNGNIIDSYGSIGGAGVQVPMTTGGGNGNGYADYLIRNFTSLAGFNATDIVTFRAIMPLTNDGKEQFFLIETAGQPPCVGICTPDPNLFGAPEPASLVLMGTGLAALAFRLRRRRA